MKDIAANERLARIFLCCMAGLLLAGQAHAEVVYNVTSALDQIDDDVTDGNCHTAANLCTLRAAIMQSNYLNGNFTVRIKLPAGVFALTRPPIGSNGEASGDLNLPLPFSVGMITIIEGESAATSVIDGVQLDRVMSIGPARKVTLSKVTIRGGSAGDGGGIRSLGSLTVLDSIVEHNAGAVGGAIFGRYMNIQRSIFRYNSGSVGGAVYFDYVADASVVIDSNFHDNSAYSGGAISIAHAAEAEIINSTITDNVASTSGGGIESLATLSLNNSTISRNTALNSGGGIVNYGAEILITGSTISSNSAGYDGGGITIVTSPSKSLLTSLAQAVFVNSTISNNSANRNGGGIFNLGTSWLYNTSIIDNDSDHDRNETGGAGGGVYNEPGNRLVATNSLIAGNTTLNAAIPDDCNGVLEVYGWNLLADYGGCSFTGNGTAARGQVSTSTIGPLASNGGPTFTHALLAGSEAIDTTTAQGCVGPTLALLVTDQRGAPRIAGPKCDVGAYEYGSVVPATDVIFSNGFD